LKLRKTSRSLAFLITVGLYSPQASLSQLDHPVSVPTTQTTNQTTEARTEKSSDSQTNASSLGQKAPLQGGVQHSEKLPAIVDNLRPGQAYSDDLLIPSGTKFNGQWLYIPAWYAGTRHCEEEMVFYRQDFKTGEISTPMLRQLNRQDDVSGCQKDRNGGIWDFKEVPRIQHLESDLVNAVLFVKEITPIFGSEDKIVIKYDEISIELNKRTNKIEQVVQQEQINSITCPKPGVLHVDVSCKAFDENGNPQRLEQCVIISKITKPYETNDRFRGQDLRSLFRDYLMSHNLEHLVPLDLVK
jgi:hypothetical protein